MRKCYALACENVAPNLFILHPEDGPHPAGVPLRRIRAFWLCDFHTDPEANWHGAQVQTIPATDSAITGLYEAVGADSDSSLICGQCYSQFEEGERFTTARVGETNTVVCLGCGVLAQVG